MYICTCAGSFPQQPPVSSVASRIPPGRPPPPSTQSIAMAAGAAAAAAAGGRLSAEEEQRQNEVCTELTHTHTHTLSLSPPSLPLSQESERIKRQSLETAVEDKIRRYVTAVLNDAEVTTQRISFTFTLISSFCLL